VRLVDDHAGAGAAFLASFDITFEIARRDAARARSSALPLLLDALPTSPLRTLSSAHWVAAGQHRLGLLMVPAAADAPVPQCS
jgi:hypothetical protein